MNLRNARNTRIARLAAAPALAAAVLAGALLTACAQETPQKPAAAAAPANPARAVDDIALDRAKAAAMAFSGQLRERLQSAMATGGPITAVEVCHTEAPQIANAVMATHGVRLGRVAAPGRNRNPAQVADDWKLATLAAFQQAVDSGAAAGEQVAVMREALPEGIALRMMRGIVTEPVCLACHGTAVAPEVRAAILASYPDDGAIGFAPGDLRGALWVEVPE